ncbi:MAG: 2-C-methyl-D-erythritol 4-phosphate cytidylyltransferase [Nitrospirae bacterium]|nr:2-C-methyl-D-erythritol 4-phosphate cytidylyltransferase [Nitrospirota bacterium]
MKETIIAIVPAAGLGTRFGPGTNKPFHPILGKPLIVWALRIFEAMDEVSEVIPVLKESDREKGIRIFEEYGLAKVKLIAPGGKERQDSVHHGLELLRGRADMVLIHDGARPLVDGALVRRTIRGIEDSDGVITGVPVKDTIKEVRDGVVARTLRREILWSVQTPQVFRYESIMNAYGRAIRERFYSTDDAALVEGAGGRVKVVMGSYGNIKVTTPEDIAVAEALLRARPEGEA